jgi:hypothetical protein
MSSSLASKPRAAVALLALLAAGLAGPARAQPRLTLRLENVTLPETLQRLSAFYGRRLHAEANVGGPTRTTFDWREAGVGVVLRDVSAQFAVTPRPEGEGGLRFAAGRPAEAGLSLTREGVALTVREIRQHEARSRTAGGAPGPAERTVTLALVVRPLDGDPLALHSLEAPRARDSAGGLLQPASPSIRWTPAPAAFPDEWPVEVAFTGVAAGARELTAVDLDVVLYRAARTHRLETPPALEAGREWAVGPAQVRRLEFPGGRRPEGRFVLVWPRGVEIEGEGPAAGIRLWARLSQGELREVPLVFGGVEVDERGEHSAEFRLRPVSLPEAPAALVWDVTARAAPDRRVTFRLPALPLPLAGPEGGAAPSKLAALTLSLPPELGRLGGELAVGLARRGERGWGPVRWTRAEADDDGRARVEGLPPGAYRLQATFRPRNSRGALGPPTSLRAPAVVSLAGGVNPAITLAR